MAHSASGPFCCVSCFLQHVRRDTRLDQPVVHLQRLGRNSECMAKLCKAGLLHSKPHFRKSQLALETRAEWKCLACAIVGSSRLVEPSEIVERIAADVVLFGSEIPRYAYAT